jgi:hypothetical protein
MPATTPLAHQAPLGQHPVHLAFRAQVGPLIEQRGSHLGRGQIADTFGAEHLNDLVRVGLRQRSGVRGPRGRLASSPASQAAGVTLAAVPEAARVDRERPAGRLDTDLRGDGRHLGVEHDSHFASALVRLC